MTTRDRPAKAMISPVLVESCDGDTCTITIYGADPEELLERLRRAQAKLSGQFAEITWRPVRARAEGT